jgi:hypothetical protein
LFSSYRQRCITPNGDVSIGESWRCTGSSLAQCCSRRALRGREEPLSFDDGCSTSQEARHASTFAATYSWGSQKIQPFSSSSDTRSSMLCRAQCDTGGSLGSLVYFCSLYDDIIGMKAQVFSSLCTF